MVLLKLPRYDPASLGIVLSVALCCSFVVWTIYARFFHTLAKYPGPFLASISRIWLAWRTIRGDLDKVQRQLHAKYGKVVRIAPDEVSISDPEAIRVIYSVNSGFTKTAFYTPWRPSFARYPDHFSSLDENIHHRRRRIVNNLYSMSSIVKSEECIDKCIDIFTIRMDEFAASRKPFNLGLWLQMFSFDVVGELFFDKMFGFLETSDDYEGYIGALDTLLPIMTVASVIPTYFRSILFASGVFFSSIRSALAAMGKIENAAEASVIQRVQLDDNEKSSRDDMLAKLLGIYQEKGEKADFYPRDIKVEVFSALLAGSDTTSIALSSILYHLMRSPRIYEKVVQEIDHATSDGSLSQPYIRFSEASKLPYLSACIKEGFRIHPSVGFTLPRHVPQPGCQIAGEHFRGGSIVGVNAAVIHFNKDIFGEDADIYNPDRWFRPEAVNMERYMFQFGGGSRTCIGKHISICEIYKLVPHILRTYHLELETPQKDWVTLNRWFNKPHGINVVVKRREQDI